MAGYVISNNGSDSVREFHTDTPNVAAVIRDSAPHKRVITLQLDGDELDAALWGLTNYRKGHHVPPS